MRILERIPIPVSRGPEAPLSQPAWYGQTIGSAGNDEILGDVAECIDQERRPGSSGPWRERIPKPEVRFSAVERG
jgi:hypothetical protein